MENRKISRQFLATLFVALLGFAVLNMAYFSIVNAWFETLYANHSLFFVFLGVGTIHLVLAPLMKFYWGEPYRGLLGRRDVSLHRQFMGAQIFLLAFFLLSEPLFLWLNWDRIDFHWQSNWGEWGLWLLPMIIAIGLQTTGEEMFFRGFLQGKLRAMSVARGHAIIWPALLWALIHQAQFDAVALKCAVVVQIFVLGLILGDWFDRTGSLAGPILVHFLMNLFAALIYGNTLRFSRYDILQADFSQLRLVDDVFYLALGAVAMMVAYSAFTRKYLVRQT